jgi:sugar phosphate isomerase/epimerase
MRDPPPVLYSRIREGLMLIGVSTHIHVYKPLGRELLEGIARSGFETVELYANNPHWPGYVNGASRREIAGICAELELPVNSVHAPFFRTLEEARAGHWLSITARDSDLRRESVERVVLGAAIAEHLPVGNIVVHLGAPDEEEDASTWDRLYYSLEEIIDSTEGLGTSVALENITNPISRGERIAAFLEKSGLPVRCCYDCGHAAIYNLLVQEFRQMEPWLATTHIHDTTDGLDNHLLPFEGEIDWQALAAAFAHSTFDGALIIETKDETGSTAMITRAAEAAESLRGMISKEREKLL